MYKKDCFAYGECDGVFECRILDDMQNCENCSAYKTWKQCYEEQKKCRKRLTAICKKFRFEWSIPNDILRGFIEDERKLSEDKTKTD